VPTDRATARALIAQRELTATAAERVLRVALRDLPVPLVPRATAQLSRFFGGAGWSAEDDAALAAAVGPGSGWYEEVLDPELSLAFGWRGGAFRVDVRYTPIESDRSDSASGDTRAATELAHERTLGDTFEETVVLEAGRSPTELCFRVGPGAGPNATLTRDNAGTDSRVAAVFRECPAIVQLAVGSGTITATIDDALHWPEELLVLFDTITAEFATPRTAARDHQLDRARSELGGLQCHDARDLAKILDATTSPDAAFRRIAIERLEGADTAAAIWPWTRGLDDSSRAVRRVTARVLATSARTDTRQILERALNDPDACVRYYAVRGLDAIGLGASESIVRQRRNDADIRVKLAMESALDGRTPA